MFQGFNRFQRFCFFLRLRVSRFSFLLKFAEEPEAVRLQLFSPLALTPAQLIGQKPVVSGFNCFECLLFLRLPFLANCLLKFAVEPCRSAPAVFSAPAQLIGRNLLLASTASSASAFSFACASRFSFLLKLLLKSLKPFGSSCFSSRSDSSSTDWSETCCFRASTASSASPFFAWASLASASCWFCRRALSRSAPAVSAPAQLIGQKPAVSGLQLLRVLLLFPCLPLPLANCLLKFLLKSLKPFGSSCFL